MVADRLKISPTFQSKKFNTFTQPDITQQSQMIIILNVEIVR